MNITTNLKKLMEAKNVSLSKLCEVTGMSQPTISKLIAGKDANATLTTLKKLAGYFNVTIGQIAGEEQLTGADGSSGPILIPLIYWESIYEHNAKIQSHSYKVWPKWISTNMHCSNKAFAVEIEKNTLPIPFYFGALAVIDPNAEPIDGSFVFVCKEKEVYLGQWIEDGRNLYFKNITTQQLIPMSKSFNENQLVIGGDNKEVYTGTVIEWIVPQSSLVRSHEHE